MPLLVVLAACSAGCDSCAGRASAPTGAEEASGVAPSQAKPELIAGKLPVAPYVAEQVEQHPGSQTVIYVGAGWCEPCQHFKQALKAGKLDVDLAGVRFIEYNLDVHKAALQYDGCGSRMIPLFALPDPGGRCSDRRIFGSIKGPGAVDNIMPRLKPLLAR